MREFDINSNRIRKRLRGLTRGVFAFSHNRLVVGDYDIWSFDPKSEVLPDKSEAVTAVLDTCAIWVRGVSEMFLVTVAKPQEWLWYRKNDTVLGLPEFNHDLRLIDIYMCEVRSMHVAALPQVLTPVREPLVGLVPQQWSTRTPISMFALETDLSNAQKRRQTNMGVLAHGALHAMATEKAHKV